MVRLGYLSLWGLFDNMDGGCDFILQASDGGG